MRHIALRTAAAAVFVLALSSPSAFGVSKEIIQLQTQVQQLQDMLQHLQTSNDERMGVLVNMVQQNTDNVNKMTALVNNLQTALKTEGDARGAASTQLSTQIQALNDSVDELKSRIANLSTQLQNLQNQMQNVNAPAASPAGSSAPATPNAGSAIPSPQAGLGGSGQVPGPAADVPQAPPADQIYQSALRDYNSAKYSLASSEFGDVIHYYPQDQLAGNSQFYLGEIQYRQDKCSLAIKSYDALLEQYSGNSKAPAAELRKGECYLQMGQKEAGVRELRALVQRYPQTPEAQEGRSKLNGMGVRIYPAKPSAYQQ